jgi:hypothetical protein
MNPEEHLSAALHATLDARRPSPDLADRIVDRLATGPRRTSRFSLRLGLAAVAAVVLVAALVPVALNFRSNGPTTSASAPVLTHYQRGDLSFDAPASWSYEPDLGDRNGATLGTGTADALGPGQVIFELSKRQALPPSAIDPTDPAGLAQGESYVTVGGLPAIFKAAGQPDAAAAAALDWQMSAPGDVTTRFYVHAEYRDPGAAQLRAQVEALVASIRDDQAAAVLDPVDGPSRAAKGIDLLQASDPTFACFPDVLGVAGLATVTTLRYLQLTKPLPVTCSFAVEPVQIGLWRVRLTESWTAAADRTAGSLVTTLWLNPDGTKNGVTEDPRLMPLPGSDPNVPGVITGLPYLP